LISFRNDDNSLEPIELDWYCRWLYTARSDGRPRVLLFSTRYCPNGISSMIALSRFILNGERLLFNIFQIPNRIFSWQTIKPAFLSAFITTALSNGTFHAKMVGPMRN
jgi:hypothetical protein